MNHQTAKRCCSNSRLACGPLKMKMLWLYTVFLKGFWHRVMLNYVFLFCFFCQMLQYILFLLMTRFDVPTFHIFFRFVLFVSDYLRNKYMYIFSKKKMMWENRDLNFKQKIIVILIFPKFVQQCATLFLFFVSQISIWLERKFSLASTFTSCRYTSFL